MGDGGGGGGGGGGGNSGIKRFSLCGLVSAFASVNVGSGCALHRKPDVSGRKRKTGSWRKPPAAHLVVVHNIH